MENQGASVDGGTGSQDDGSSVVNGAGDAGASQGQETGVEATEGVTEGAGGQAETDDEFGVGQEGDIPRERWNQFYAKHKETETKLQEALSFFETIQSDPDVRQKFVESLKGGQSDDSVKEVPQENKQPSNFEQFLAQTPALAQSPEHQALFGNFGKAVADDLQGHLNENYVSKKELESMIAPLKRYVGDTEVANFYKRTPKAATYERQIVEMQRKHPTLSLDQAFKLASDTDNKVRSAGENKAKQNQDRLKNTPINGKSANTNGQTRQPLPKVGAEAEAVRRAFAKLGIS